MATESRRTAYDHVGDVAFMMHDLKERFGISEEEVKHELNYNRNRIAYKYRDQRQLLQWEAESETWSYFYSRAKSEYAAMYRKPLPVPRSDDDDIPRRTPSPCLFSDRAIENAVVRLLETGDHRLPTERTSTSKPADREGDSATKDQDIKRQEQTDFTEQEKNAAFNRVMALIAPRPFRRWQSSLIAQIDHELVAPPGKVNRFPFLDGKPQYLVNLKAPNALRITEPPAFQELEFGFKVMIERYIKGAEEVDLWFQPIGSENVNDEQTRNKWNGVYGILNEWAATQCWSFQYRMPLAVRMDEFLLVWTRARGLQDVRVPDGWRPSYENHASPPESSKSHGDDVPAEDSDATVSN